MQRSRILETPLRHPGTGRAAAVVRAQNFWGCEPVAVATGKYVLVMASERAAELSSVETARAWVDAGACYVCVWGPAAPEVEDTFDYASFLPDLGEPVPFALMTTSHQDALEEALWFAFYNGRVPDETDDRMCPVIVVVDSEVLEDRCVNWVQQNAEWTAFSWPEDTNGR